MCRAVHNTATARDGQWRCRSVVSDADSRCRSGAVAPAAGRCAWPNRHARLYRHPYEYLPTVYQQHQWSSSSPAVRPTARNTALPSSLPRFPTVATAVFSHPRPPWPTCYH